jgi:hypothetical protein
LSFEHDDWGECSLKGLFDAANFFVNADVALFLPSF